MKIRHVKSLFHIISLEKVTFCFAHCQKSRRIVLRLLRSHLDGSKALRNYCCECNDLLAKQNPKKSAQEASFGAFYFTFSSLWLFRRRIGEIGRKVQGYKAHVHFTRLDGACSAQTANLKSWSWSYAWVESFFQSLVAWIVTDVPIETLKSKDCVMKDKIVSVNRIYSIFKDWEIV